MSTISRNQHSKWLSWSSIVLPTLFIAYALLVNSLPLGTTRQILREAMVPLTAGVPIIGLVMGIAYWKSPSAKVGVIVNLLFIGFIVYGFLVLLPHAIRGPGSF